MNYGTQIAGKMLGGYRVPVENAKVNLGPLLAKMKETENLARKYQSGTPAKVDLTPLLRKLKEAEALGYALQQKAASGRL